MNEKQIANIGRTISTAILIAGITALAIYFKNPKLMFWYFAILVTIPYN